VCEREKERERKREKEREYIILRSLFRVPSIKMPDFFAQHSPERDTHSI
jgi:hypothetical protein